MADHLNYALILDQMMQLLIKTILQKIQKYGLYDEHSIHITFVTHATGVQIPEKIRKIYPNEITIILQYQFDDLQVNDDNFSVVLSFDEMRETVVVPFKAIIGFIDPSAHFAIGTRMDNKVSIKQSNASKTKDSGNAPRATDARKMVGAKKTKAKAKVIKFDTIKAKHRECNDSDE